MNKTKKNVTRRNVLAGAGAALASANAAAQTKSKPRQGKKPYKQPTIRFINPPALAAPPGYTHVVEARGGRMVFIAGQVALDQAGKLVGASDVLGQAKQVFENLAAALAAAGASFKDVVKLNYYLTDLAQLPALRQLRDQYVNTSQPPASTLVAVKALFREEFLIEIEAIAIAPE